MCNSIFELLADTIAVTAVSLNLIFPRWLKIGFAKILKQKNNAKYLKKYYDL